MKASEYWQYDGLGLADLVRNRQVSPRELFECALSIAEEVNPKLNALCYVRADDARKRADCWEGGGLFGGLPFLLKDSGLAYRYLPSSVGSRLFEGMTSPIDATLTKRFLAAGFLPFGRTTVPEFCMAPTTEAVVNGGPTRNPWALDRSAGGSSGGAAAAVAAGILPVAHGSDGGGSIRIPASCCGVVGLKPSRGLIPHGPARGEAWAGLASDGVLTRTVRDTAAALDVIAGMEEGAPYAAPAMPQSYLAEIGKSFERPLRIAQWTTAFEDIEVAPDCVVAVEETASHLRSLGHEVEESPLPAIQFHKFLDAMIDVMAASVTVTVNGFLRGRQGVDVEGLLEPALYDAYRRGASVSAETYVLAINRFHQIGRTIESYLGNFDFILTPTLTQPPARLGSISTDEDFLTFRRKIGRYTTFLAIINASGQPAVSLPTHWNAEGLPIGVQLIGRFGDEAGILRLAAQLEATAPWSHRWPLL